MPSPITEARSLIAKTLAAHAGRACLTCSFQAEDMVVLHLARQLDERIPVLFLDTGYHFPETVAYRDRMTAEWGLNLINLRAAKSVAEQENELGLLYRSEPSRCCGLRKVEPLMAALRGYSGWLTGLRREQSPTRAHLQPEERHLLPTGEVLEKVSPLAHWTWKEVLAYATVEEIPLLPLYEEGYPSVGCAPCTSKPLAGADPRSGRWGGQKLECGIHTVTTGA
jgi:phosphoadenosine phosphosulfate reductase